MSSNELWDELIALRRSGVEPVDCYCAICDEYRRCMRCFRKDRTLFVCVACAFNNDPPEWWPTS